MAATLARRTGAEHQRELAGRYGLEGVLPELSSAFLDPTTLVEEATALAAAARS